MLCKQLQILVAFSITGHIPKSILSLHQVLGLPAAFEPVALARKWPTFHSQPLCGENRIGFLISAMIAVFVVRSYLPCVGPTACSDAS